MGWRTRKAGAPAASGEASGRAYETARLPGPPPGHGMARPGAGILQRKRPFFPLEQLAPFQFQTGRLGPRPGHLFSASAAVQEVGVRLPIAVPGAPGLPAVPGAQIVESDRLLQVAI